MAAHVKLAQVKKKEWALKHSSLSLSVCLTKWSRYRAIYCCCPLSKNQFLVISLLNDLFKGTKSVQLPGHRCLMLPLCLQRFLNKDTCSFLHLWNFSCKTVPANSRNLSDCVWLLLSYLLLLFVQSCAYNRKYHFEMEQNTADIQSVHDSRYRKHEKLGPKHWQPIRVSCMAFGQYETYKTTPYLTRRW